MRTEQPVTIHRSDYRPPAFRIETIDLVFDLDPAQTIVARVCTFAATTALRRMRRLSWMAKRSS